MRAARPLLTVALAAGAALAVGGGSVAWFASRMRAHDLLMLPAWTLLAPATVMAACALSAAALVLGVLRLRGWPLPRPGLLAAGAVLVVSSALVAATPVSISYQPDCNTVRETVPAVAVPYLELVRPHDAGPGYFGIVTAMHCGPMPVGELAPPRADRHG